MVALPGRFQQLVIFVSELLLGLVREPVGVPVSFPENPEEELAHLQSPSLLVDLMFKLELTEVVGVAQGVRAGVVLIAGKPIVHQDALISGDESKLIEGAAPTLSVDSQPSQPSADQDVQPGSSLGTQATFVGTENRAVEQGRCDLFADRLELRSRLGDPVDQARSRGTSAAETLQQLAGAGHRNHVVLVQPDGEGLEPRAILHRRFQGGWVRRHLRLGTAAPSAPNAMLGDLDR